MGNSGSYGLDACEGCFYRVNNLFCESRTRKLALVFPVDKHNVCRSLCLLDTHKRDQVRQLQPPRDLFWHSCGHGNRKQHLEPWIHVFRPLQHVLFAQVRFRSCCLYIYCLHTGRTRSSRCSARFCSSPASARPCTTPPDGLLFAAFIFVVLMCLLCRYGFGLLDGSPMLFLITISLLALLGIACVDQRCAKLCA